MSVHAAKTSVRDVAAQDTRLRILRAAEQVFSREGFHGASMRSIAESAGVAPGLLHYHFDTKKKLFAAIVGWRAAIINGERIELLKTCSPAADLDEVLRALFAPALGTDAGGEAYGRIMASLTTGEAMYQDLVCQHYDPTARLFIDAIINALPALSHSQAVWGYNLAIHVLVAGMARTGRIEHLIGEDATGKAETYLDRLTEFACGGIRQMASDCAGVRG